MSKPNQQAVITWSENEIRANTSGKSDPLYVLNNELKAFLNLNRLPARLNVAQTAACLGFAPYHIPVLVARGFLKPLGHPKPNGEKYFARSKVLEHAEDEKWLSLATDALSQCWRMKNSKTKENGRQL
jgi:hypothetical protein